ITVRCAPRFLVSPHLLGPESRTFELSLKKGMLKSPTLMTMHRAVVDSTSNMGSLAKTVVLAYQLTYAALLVFYYRPIFLVLKAELLSSHWKGYLKYSTLMTMSLHGS